MSPFPRKPRPDPIPGIYFIQGADGGPIKIGRAQDPTMRLDQLQTGTWDELRIRAVWPILDSALCAELEVDLHKHFAAQRIRGEWFTATPELDVVIARSAAAVRSSWGTGFRDAREQLRELLRDVRTEFGDGDGDRSPEGSAHA